MGILFYVALSILIFCFIAVIVLGVINVITIIEVKQSDAKIKKINDCIKKVLDCYCQEKQIKVIWEDEFTRDHKDAAAYISYYLDRDRPANAEIHLLNSQREIYEYLSWGTYAHEIGHYISVNYYGDTSEEGADLEAYKLINFILPEKDKRIIRSTIVICFNHGDYTHPESKYISKTFIESDMYFRKELKKYYGDIRNHAD